MRIRSLIGKDKAVCRGDKSNRDSKTNRSNNKAEERRKGKATGASRWDTIPLLTRGGESEGGLGMIHYGEGEG